MSQSIDDPMGRHFQDFNKIEENNQQQDLLQKQNIEQQPLRNINSSNDIVKLYQTRDCLGRIVCEW